jgi:hypothetical protein
MTLEDCKTLEEVENYRVGKIKELQEQRKFRNIVKQEKLIAQRDKIRLQEKIKDLEINEDKANNIISELNTEIDLATNLFWRMKQ